MSKANKTTASKKNGTKTTKSRKKKSIKKLRDFYGFSFFDTCAMTQPIADALAEELFEWACKNRHDALTLEEFTSRRGIRLDVFFAWFKRFPVLKESWERAKEYIGNNREVGALKKELAEKTVLRSLPHYSKRWKNIEEWWSTLAAKQQEELKDFVFKLVDITSRDKE